MARKQDLEDIEKLAKLAKWLHYTKRYFVVDGKLFQAGFESCSDAQALMYIELDPDFEIGVGLPVVMKYLEHLTSSAPNKDIVTLLSVFHSRG